jgi:hypothetical protein
MPVSVSVPVSVPVPMEGVARTDDLEEGEETLSDVDDDAMAAMLGFAGFGTTKVRAHTHRQQERERVCVCVCV